MSRAVALTLVIASAGAVLLAEQTPAAQRPVFRTAADLVTVPVMVRVSGTPVGGLTPDDFLVLDNGVPQKVQSLEGEAVPADITILVETSLAMKAYMGPLAEQVRKISAMARPADRLEVIGIDTYVEPLLPLKAAAEQSPLGRLRVGGLASVNDALVAALLREPDTERPHLIIAITDTVDTMSMTEMTTVRDVAKQSGATLVIAWVTMSIDAVGGTSWYTTSEREKQAVAAPIMPPPPTDATVARSQHEPSIGNGRSVDRARYWVPHYTPPAGRKISAFDTLTEAAETTGGALHPPGVFTDRSAAAIFEKLFNDYRRSYILRYAAEGVARDGWHDITVTTPKYPSYQLRARKGYFVETPKAPVDRATLPPGSLLALAAAADAGDAGAIEDTLRQNRTSADLLKLLKEFKAGGAAFPTAPRREFVLALDAAESALPSSNSLVLAAVYEHLNRYSQSVRQVSGRDGFEKDWFAAALGLVQARLRPDDAGKLVEAATKRFRDEPRFVLARAVIADQTLHLKKSGGALAERDAAAVSADYDAAMASALTRDEAAIRKAWLLHRLSRPADGLAALDQTGPIDADPTLRYWRELIRGTLLDDLGRLPDAAAAFRSALAIAPDAQSARIGLMTSLARSGRVDEARIVAEAIAAAPPESDDPWWDYWKADYRFFPGLMARMRGAMK
jgi:VWFA-related protein